MTIYALLRMFGWVVFAWLAWRALKYAKRESTKVFLCYALVLVPNEVWHYTGAYVGQPLQGYISWSLHIITVVALILLVWQVLKKS